MSLDSTTQNEVPLQTRNDPHSHRAVLVTTTLYPMDIPASLIPPIKDASPRNSKKIKLRNYSYKLSHSRDKSNTSLNDNFVYKSVDNCDTGLVKDFQTDSPFCFDKDMVFENSTHYRISHGVNYVQNYKSILKQRGVRYHEIFGRSPRKPEERSGLTKAQTPSRERPEPPQNTLIETPSEQSYRLRAGGKFPSIRNDNNNSRLEMNLKSKENSVALLNYESGDDFIDSISSRTIPKGDDVTESLQRTIDDNLNDVISRDSVTTSPTSQKRTPRRHKGKLGNIMTPRHMEQMLESNNALLKFEDGLKYPFQK